MIKTVKWEPIDNETDRLRVFGGWILRTRMYVSYNLTDHNRYKSDVRSVHQVLVPDPNHAWEL